MKWLKENFASGFGSWLLFIGYWRLFIGNWQMRQHPQSVPEGHGEAGDGERFGGGDDQLAAGVMVVAVGAFGKGDTPDKAAAGDGEGEEFVPDDAQPDRRTPPPAPGIDAGGRAQAEHRFDRAAEFAQELLFESVHWVNGRSQVSVFSFLP